MLGAVYRSLLHRSTDHSLHGIRADLLSAVLLPLPGSNKVRGNINHQGESACRSDFPEQHSRSVGEKVEAKYARSQLKTSVIVPKELILGVISRISINN